MPLKLSIVFAVRCKWGRGENGVLGVSLWPSIDLTTHARVASMRQSAAVFDLAWPVCGEAWRMEVFPRKPSPCWARWRVGHSQQYLK